MFRLSRIGLAAAVVLTAVAMFLYPGGTLFDRTSRGYSFFENSFSDLGSTVAWNGQSNPGSSIEFAAAILPHNPVVVRERAYFDGAIERHATLDCS